MTITLLLNRYEDPYVIIAGDFNRRNLARAIGNFPQIKQIQTPPTRGEASLDLVASNMSEILLDCGVTDSIVNEFGVPTDHETLFCSFRMPRVPQYKIESYTYHHICNNGDLKFGEWLDGKESEGWDEVFMSKTTSEMVDKLHSEFSSAMDSCYELKTRKKKTSEPVWMADWIRILIARRRSIYRGEGRSDRWHTLKCKIMAIIKTRKDKYFQGIRDKFLSNTDPKHFHECVKALLQGNSPPKWDVRTLKPDKSDEELAEWLADFFNGISSEYEPLDPSTIPSTFDRQLPIITEEEVVKKLRKAKKKNSKVPGDIDSRLYDKYASKLAVPITFIFNKIAELNEWPEAWKVEHVTVIPKNNAASTPGECRNISCTNFLSKVYESFVLAWAREEVWPKENQFGGEPGSGSEHFAVRTMNFITGALEDNRAAVVLSAIDFSKAFNRLEHGSCLKAFERKGASSQIIKLLASFLTGRSMAVRIGGARSSLCPVNVGAPQGSVLGCYLFNIGIDNIEEQLSTPPNTPKAIETVPASRDFPAVSTPTRVGPTGPAPPQSPIPPNELDIEFLPKATNVPPWLLKPKDAKWKDVQVQNEKFVDDGLYMSVVNMRAEPLLEQNGLLYKETKAPEAQQMLEHLTRRAAERGMVVNDKKRRSCVCPEPKLLRLGSLWREETAK